MDRQSWKFIVEPGQEGLRLDQLVSQSTGLSRRKAREALMLGGVQVDRKRVKVAGRPVKAGQEIRVSIDETLSEFPDIVLEVLYEDPWLLAVNKPAGLPTQGTQASDRHDLMALLKRQRPELELRLVHRLDQGTSGLLVLAKDGGSAANLSRIWQERDVRKIYLARVSKIVEECEIDRPIGRLRVACPTRFACEGDLLDPKQSRTYVRPAINEEVDGFAPGHWLVCEPKTGRTHQIRVHLVSIGAPILGDTLYGGVASDRLWLHAWKLELEHPTTGEVLRLVAGPQCFMKSTDRGDGP